MQRFALNKSRTIRLLSMQNGPSSTASSNSFIKLVLKSSSQGCQRAILQPSGLRIEEYSALVVSQQEILSASCKPLEGVYRAHAQILSGNTSGCAGDSRSDRSEMNGTTCLKNVHRRKLAHYCLEEVQTNSLKRLSAVYMTLLWSLSEQLKTAK